MTSDSLHAVWADEWPYPFIFQLVSAVPAKSSPAISADALASLHPQQVSDLQFIALDLTF